MKKRLFATSLLALTLGFGVAAGLSLAKKQNSVKVKAEYSQGSVIANDKARIWIGYDTSNPFYSYADANTGIRLWIHSTSSGGTEKVYGTITGTFNNGAESNRRYDFFDVDLAHYTNSWYMTVQKFENNAWKAQTNPIQLSASNAFQVYYVWGDWAWDKTQGTVAAGGVSSVDAGFAAKALGGMHSCSSSNVNGYNAFPNFNSTFVKDGDDNWKTSGNLGDYSLNDFASGDTSYSGSTSNTINAYDKYVFVQNMYNSGGRSGLSSSRVNLLNDNNEIGSNNAIAIVLTSTAGIAAAGGYFVLRKKKIKQLKQ